MMQPNTRASYYILDLKEEDGELWAKIKLDDEQPDLALAARLQEFEHVAGKQGLTLSEALNWVLTIPGLDDFFAQVVEHKKQILQ